MSLEQENAKGIQELNKTLSTFVLDFREEIHKLTLALQSQTAILTKQQAIDQLTVIRNKERIDRMEPRLESIEIKLEAMENRAKGWFDVSNLLWSLSGGLLVFLFQKFIK